MKSYRQFCKDANIIEDWNLFSKSTKSTKPAPAPKEVLAYKNYQPGVLNKDTKKFTKRAHTPDEQKRYGWKPVEVSSYSKADTPGSTTASGERFSDTARGVAVPYKSKTSNAPSIPFGTQLQLTKAPGTKAPVATTRSFDTGNFGKAGDYNKTTSFDLARQTAADVSGKPDMTSKEFGKQKVYVRNAPAPTVSTKTKPTK